mgnify:CR=1 FL=1
MPRYILQQLDIHDPTMIKVASGVEVATMAWAVGTNPMGIGLSFEMRCLAGGLVWIGYEHLLQPATHQQALRSSSRRL